MQNFDRDLQNAKFGMGFGFAQNVICAKIQNGIWEKRNFYKCLSRPPYLPFYRSFPFYHLSVSCHSQVHIKGPYFRMRLKLITETKMSFTEYLKRRALVFHSIGLSPAAIAKALSNEWLVVTRQGIKKFLDRYEETGTLERRPRSGRPSRITQAVKAIVEEQRTTKQLQ